MRYSHTMNWVLRASNMLGEKQPRFVLQNTSRTEILSLLKFDGISRVSKSGSDTTRDNMDKPQLSKLTER